MAARLAVPWTRYLRWEAGEHHPDLRGLPIVLSALGGAPAVPADTSLGARLKAWRTARGLSQLEAAARAGLDAKTWGKVERGVATSKPSVSAVEGVLADPARSPNP
jgi:DNA-binding XRE family transcriptional regulator